ncbi:hypothetical protein POM88_048284 [Heracleum sosnowskyi]|uniref:Uncharacterized protein n=1 Tax=Heracleum sosnowskyi TaxID=360622 RepID=A0AAD8GV01_9APIA|nr:hypothetical protein POM88_048284 [Heracleum sosnowskyi]
MVSTRRSGKESEVVCKPDQNVKKCKTFYKRKKLLRGHQQQQEDHLVTPPVTSRQEKEAQVQNMGGEEVMPLDISSDEEETKPQVDHLSMLMSVSRQYFHLETSQKNLEILMAAAVVLKDELVSHLEKTAHKLNIADMVRSANKCFTGLKSLKVDYGAFSGEVRKLIEYLQELQKANEKNTCTDLGLTVAYEKSLSDFHEAMEELITAGCNLSNAKTSYDSAIERIEMLKRMLQRAEEEATRGRIEIEKLTSKRDDFEESFSLAGRSKERYEKIQSSFSRLRDLDNKHEAANAYADAAHCYRRDITRRAKLVSY